MRQRLGGVIAVGMLFLLFSLSFVSAVGYSSGGFDHSYKGPFGSSSSNYYFKSYNDGSGYYDYNGRYRYPIKQHANTPIFKGSYGNYRYQMYDAGDYRPSLFFVDYPESYARPYFSGGVQNYYGGFGGLGGYGLGIYSGYNYPSYSFNNYGNNYYPSYDYQYLGGCSYSYC